METEQVRDRYEQLAGAAQSQGMGGHGDSLVLLTLKDRRLVLTARIDLPPPQRVDLSVSALLPALLTERPDAIILVGYEAVEGDSVAALEAASMRSTIRWAGRAAHSTYRGWFARTTVFPTTIAAESVVVPV